MDSKPYLCRHCKRPLGHTNDSVLTIGAAEFRLVSTFTCGGCGRRLTWRPDKKENVNQKPVLVSATV